MFAMIGMMPNTVMADIPLDRLREINRISEIMTTKWSNLAIHKEKDGVNVQKIIDGLKKRAGGSDEDYFVALYETAGLFRDSHVNIFWPKDGILKKYTSGLRVARVREGYAVIQCTPPTNCGNLPLPTSVIEVDGKPIDDWIRQRATVLGGSTKLGRQSRAMINLGWYTAIRQNPPAQSVTLLLPNSVIKTVNLNWEKYVWWDKEAGEPEPHCIKGERHPSGTFILTVEAFDCGLPGDRSWKNGYRRFVRNLKGALKNARNADSIIVDVRENGGGKPWIAKTIMQLLIDKETLYETEFPFDEKRETYGEPKERTAFPKKKWRKYFQGFPSAILSGIECGSACAYFVLAVKTASTAMVLGEPAEGSNGSPKYYELSVSGAILTVPSDQWPWGRSLGADGQPMERRLINVDKKILPSINDYRNAKDPILEEAIRDFRKEWSLRTK
ncbi:MAG: S41 family peptidase [Deltaproteobacteria bacterium]|nr:S41 family peptidase [Deltaproteobacteria bacterium]